VDLLVIKETEQERWDRRREVVRILRPVAGKTELDVRVLTPSELDLELRDGNHFYQEVLYRGTLVYGDEEVYPMVEDSTPYAKAWLSLLWRTCRRQSFSWTMAEHPTRWASSSNSPWRST
jgi:hypothetical protein